jgi:hypothetical protein
LFALAVPLRRKGVAMSEVAPLVGTQRAAGRPAERV